MFEVQIIKPQYSRSFIYCELFIKQLVKHLLTFKVGGPTVSIQDKQTLLTCGKEKKKFGNEPKASILVQNAIFFNALLNLY